MSYYFISDRLGFRSFNEHDVNALHNINSDKESMKYFPSTLTMQETENLIQKIKDHIRKHTFGFFAVDHLKDDKMIGFIGLKHTNFEADFTPCIEIGWRLNKEYWNQGLATEGAKRCLNLAFNDLSLNKMVSFTTLGNYPSERVMQKIGMKKVYEFDHPALKSESPLKRHCLYSLTRKEYLSGME